LIIKRLLTIAENNTTAFVIDASYLLGWLLPDETVTEVSNIMQQYTDGSLCLFSNELLPFEIANGLRSATIQNRITVKQASKLLDAFMHLGITLENVNINQVWNLSQKYLLTCYDAAYLSLAYEKKLPLLTRDATLAKII